MPDFRYIGRCISEGPGNSEGEGTRPTLALLLTLRRWVLALVREVRDGALDYRAMGLVYTTLLSLAPLLAVSFSVLKAFGVHNQLQPFLLEMLSPLGEKRQELTANIIGFVENINVGVLGSLGLALLFYSVVSLLAKIEDCFNHIWGITASRPWTRRFSDYLSILLIGPVLVFSALGVMATMASGELVQRMVSLQPFGALYYLAGQFIPFALMIAAFTFGYSFMPNTRVKLTAALVGGICAGVIWKIVGWAFGAIVAESASYNAIYSGFAIIILFMIWLYVSWFILLIGGVISFFWQHPDCLRHETRHPQLSHRQRESLGFALMYGIAKAYYAGDPPLTLDELAKTLALPAQPVSESLNLLLTGDLLRAMHTDPESYLPAKPPENLTLQEIYAASRASEHASLPSTAWRDGGSSIEELAERLENSASRVLSGLTLKDLVFGKDTQGISAKIEQGAQTTDVFENHRPGALV